MSEKGNDVIESSPNFHSATMVSRQPQLDIFHNKNLLDGSGKSTSVSPSDGSKVLVVVDSTPSSSSTWSVTKLMAVPSFYKLERTHVRISDVALNEVTRRIVDAIRNESIAAVYDSSEAKVSAETKCSCKFVLRLWSSAGNQIIVECQRESGCGFKFCETVKKILKAAKTGIIKKKKTGSASSKFSLANPPVLTATEPPSSSPDVIPLDDPLSLVEDSLSIARDSLKGNRVDYQLLAIHSLCQLSSSPACRRYAATSIVATPSNRDVMDILESLILYSRLDGGRAGRKNESEFSSVEVEHYNEMHRMALNILANCLATLEEFGELTYALSSDTWILSDVLLNTLVHTVASSGTRPHEAADAFKCLDMLCLRSDYAEKRVIDLGGSLYLNKQPIFY